MDATVMEIADFMAEEDRGLGGEFLAYMALQELPAGWRLLRNLLVFSAAGETHETEIDMVLIHRSGVYVLEIKEYGGCISGNPKQKMWTQSFPDGIKRLYYNPVWQNYGHMQAMKQALALFGNVPLHPIVVFGDHCEFRTQLSSPEHPVIHRQALAETVMSIAEEVGGRLGAFDAETIYMYLKPLENPSKWRRERHLREVMSMSGKGRKTFSVH